MTEKTIHEGRNVKRIREIMGIKQDAMALELGMTQQAVSLLEQKEKIDDKILAELSKILEVPVEAIKNFNDENAFNIISNNFNSHDSSTMNAVNCYPTFNPLDKIVELYEALLKSEREKIALLERMIDKK